MCVLFVKQDEKSVRDVSFSVLEKLGSLAFRIDGFPMRLAEAVRLLLTSKRRLDEKALILTLSAFGALGACFWEELAEEYEALFPRAVRLKSDPRVRCKTLCVWLRRCVELLRCCISAVGSIKLGRGSEQEWRVQL